MRVEVLCPPRLLLDKAVLLSHVLDKPMSGKVLQRRNRMKNLYDDCEVHVWET